MPETYLNIIAVWEESLVACASEEISQKSLTASPLNEYDDGTDSQAKVLILKHSPSLYFNVLQEPIQRSLGSLTRPNSA